MSRGLGREASGIRVCKIIQDYRGRLWRSVGEDLAGVQGVQERGRLRKTTVAGRAVWGGLGKLLLEVLARGWKICQGLEEARMYRWRVGHAGSERARLRGMDARWKQ